MRAKSLLQCTAFVSRAWTIVSFTTVQSTSKYCYKRGTSSFVTPNDSLEDSRKSISTDVDKLLPFLPAADPRWSCIGPVGKDVFVLNREGGPTEAELSNENILKIVTIECSDLEVNTIVWKCLGYRFNSQTDEWSASECFPKWREKCPTPPDLIGMQRMYVLKYIFRICLLSSHHSYFCELKKQSFLDILLKLISRA
jgi:hypothetical protein